MTNNETTTIEALQKIDLSKLDTVTIESIRQQKPRIFDKESFTFVVNDLSKALVITDHPTKVGSGNMYVLDTVSRIYTFGNAYDQLEKFYKEHNLAKGSKIRYVRKFIPEGKESFDTKYLFEEAKVMKK